MYLMYRKGQKLAKEKFCGLLDFIQMQGKLLQFCFILLKVLPLLKAFIAKTFAVYVKSAKVAKVFSHA